MLYRHWIFFSRSAYSQYSPQIKLAGCLRRVPAFWKVLRKFQKVYSTLLGGSFLNISGSQDTYADEILIKTLKNLQLKLSLVKIFSGFEIRLNVDVNILKIL